MTERKYTEDEFINFATEAFAGAPQVQLTMPPHKLFALIGYLQFAQRGLPFGHRTRLAVEEMGRELQAVLVRATTPDMARWIDLGWNEEYDVDDQGNFVHQPIGRATETVKVHNCWTIYGANPDGSESETKLAEFGRPQDWGDPRWQYTRFRFDWLAPDGKHYINHAHCWTDIPGLKPGDLPELFASLIVRIMMPGHKEQLCARDYLHPEDFWSSEWGEMPPIYEEEW